MMSLCLVKSLIVALGCSVKFYLKTPSVHLQMLVTAVGAIVRF